jgi:NADH:ubiquinone reductase (H+-translocating)
LNNTKKIVILGAGYGGVHAAKVLSKKYKKDENVEIILIDKMPNHILMTELHEIAGSRVDPSSVMIDIRQIFHKSKVKVVTEEVTKIDLEKQKLITNYHEFAYDYLVLGTGSEPAYFGTPGVKENGFSLWSIDDALKLREHIEKTFKKAALEKDTEKRKALLTFVVAGAGFTGIETIGELIDAKKVFSKKYNVDIKEVKLMVVEAVARILNILDDGNVEKSEKFLYKNNVELRKNAPIVEVNPDSMVLKDGTVIPTYTLIWTCGIQGKEINSKFGLTMGKKGRIQTNEFMQSVDKENVYIVGDSAYYEEKDSPRGLPQIVETALQTADTAAHNIIADIEKSTKEKFKSNYHGFMVSIGSHYGVANLNGFKPSGFFALVMKHLVNMHYLFGIGGFKFIFQYLNHEFFGIKDQRSIMGGHLSRKSSTLFLVVLRLYIGVLWVIEGVNKIQQGWLSPDKIYIVQVAGTSSASQTATSTTAKAATTVVPILSQPPHFFTAFMNTFIAPYAHFFQSSIVLMEVAIGLALIAGCFTFLASLASIFLAINFILSAMAGVEIFWYIFGGIALLGGAGRSFGLDYYIMPVIFRWFKNFVLGESKPVYQDKI